jgi:hypothetical protein
MVLDDEYGEFEMNNEYVRSVDFIGNLIDLDLIWTVERIFRNNCQSYEEYESEMFNLSMQGKLSFPETRHRLYGHICKRIGKYTPIPTTEFASILAPLSAEEFESDEAFEALLQPLENWIERLSHLPAVEVA